MPIIAANIARLRSTRSLSLEAFAALAQLSPLTLRRIEKGSELPTIDMLWSVANGLGIAFSALIQPQLQAADTPAVPQLPRRSLLPSARGGLRQTELHQMTLPPHGEGLAPAGEPQTIESLLVTAGELVVYYQGESRVLSVGEEVEVPAYVERRYLNPTNQTTVIYAKLGPSQYA